MELCSVLYASLDGKGVWGRMDICICIAESLCCSSGIITTLLIICTPIEIKQFKVWRKKKVLKWSNMRTQQPSLLAVTVWERKWGFPIMTFLVHLSCNPSSLSFLIPPNLFFQQLGVESCYSFQKLTFLFWRLELLLHMFSSTEVFEVFWGVV